MSKKLKNPFRFRILHLLNINKCYINVNLIYFFKVLLIFQVKGKGVSNPYRLRPFISARIPLNGTFVSSIKLHNPHSEMLLITEIYTSGGEIHLELPNTLNGIGKVVCGNLNHFKQKLS